MCTSWKVHGVRAVVSISAHCRGMVRSCQTHLQIAFLLQKKRPYSGCIYLQNWSCIFQMARIEGNRDLCLLLPVNILGEIRRSIF